MIRTMRWWDLAQVHQIETQSFGAAAWSPEQFWAELARVPESRWYVVAYAGEEGASDVMGYAGLFVAGDAADIQTIAVAPAARRSGVARELLDALDSRAHVLGLRALHLEVAAGNDAARRLYLSSGFVVVGRRRDYYAPGQDAELMTRDLT